MRRQHTHARAAAPAAVELRMGPDLAAALERLAGFLAVLQAGVPVGTAGPTGEPTDGPSHAPDWSVVRWNGVPYRLGRKQRLVAAHLWRAWHAGTPFVSETRLLNAADSLQSKLAQLFKGSAAWGKLIVPGETHGGAFDTFCLAPPDPGRGR